VGDIDLKVISATKISNKFQKTRIWKEKSVGDVVTPGPMTQTTLQVHTHIHMQMWMHMPLCGKSGHCILFTPLQFHHRPALVTLGTHHNLLPIVVGSSQIRPRGT